MTYSHHNKVLEQIGSKPAKVKKYDKHNVPRARTTGKATKTCDRCGNHRAVIRKYAINICRKCFREVAGQMGFTKYE